MNSADTLIHGNYEYAGFYYQIHQDKRGSPLYAIPHAGQHSAALRDKHRRAACSQFDEEYRWSDRKPRVVCKDEAFYDTGR